MLLCCHAGATDPPAPGKVDGGATGANNYYAVELSASLQAAGNVNNEISPIAFTAVPIATVTYTGYGI